MSKYDKLKIIEKIMLYFYSLQKNCKIWKNCNFCFKIQLYCIKVSKKMLKYTFLKSPWPMTVPFQVCTIKDCKICYNFMCNQENWKCANFFAELVQFLCLCHRFSKKLKIIQILKLKVSKNKDLICCRKK